MKLPLQVDVIVFHKFGNEYKYLMMRRTQDRGGFWQLLTGGVEDGEKISDAVLRETYEESGYEKKDIIRVIDLDYSFQFKLKNRDFWITEYVFAVEVKHPNFIRLEKEHDLVQWNTHEEAVKLLKFDTNLETLRLLKEHIEKK